MNTIKTDVLIIGGGLTGLTLAYYLKDLNITFKIVEARAIVGGRIKTKYNANQAPVELGATWIINQQTATLKLLKELNIPIFRQHYGTTAIYHPNVEHPPKLVQLPANNASSYRVKGGTYKIIETLKAALNKTDIIYNEKITSIKASNNNLEAKSKACVYHCKFIVSTLPPLLLSNSITISPNLPENTEHLLKNTHTWMQDSIRVGFTYKNPFWKSDRTSGTIYSSIGPLQEFYDHSNALDNLHALSGFMKNSYSNQTKEERKTNALAQLQSYYGDQALHYDSYEECVWKNEKNTVVGSDHFLMPQTNNGNPLFKEAYLNNRFFIAGAETSPLFSGKMEGAITSAQFVLEKLKTLKATN